MFIVSGKKCSGAPLLPETPDFSFPSEQRPLISSYCVCVSFTQSRFSKIVVDNNRICVYLCINFGKVVARFSQGHLSELMGVMR